MRLTTWLDELKAEERKRLPSQRAGIGHLQARMANALGVSIRRLEYLMEREGKASSRPVKPKRRDRAAIVARQRKARNWPV